MPRPNHEREGPVGDRTRLVNRMKSALARLDIRDFKPTPPMSMTHITTFGCMVLPSRRMRSLTLARNSQERALSRVASKSLARRRLRLS
jgi:hypothetical protein